MKKIMILVILSMFLLSSTGYAEIYFEMEDAPLITDYDNIQCLPENVDYFGEYDGYITTLNGEQYYYIYGDKRYHGYQKIYSREVFDKFKSTYKDLFQYEKTDNGYIVCTPGYRINFQNLGWTNLDDKYSVHLYDNDLNLLASKKFDKEIYSVGYLDGFYFVEFVNGGQYMYEPYYFTYKKSNDFENWVDCENPRKTFDNVKYEFDASYVLYHKVGQIYLTYSSEHNREYLSTNGIYSLRTNLENSIPTNSIYWEDELYLYVREPKAIRKTLKQPLYDALNALEELPIIKINDTILGFDTPPVMEADRTLVPMRFLFEQLGAEVQWDEATQSATATNGDTAVTFSINNRAATVDGRAATMDVPARLINDKTMVPLRFLSEELGYTVEWDEETRCATVITTDNNETTVTE